MAAARGTILLRVVVSPRRVPPVYDVYARDAEAAFEPLELCDVYVADDVDDGHLLRLDAEDRHPLDPARVGRHVDLRVVFVRVARFDVHDARPARPAQLLAHRRDIGLRELAFLPELVALHVDAPEAGD